MLRARTTAVALVAAAALACGGNAFAADDAGEGGHLQVGVIGGTLGVGPEVGYRINRMFGVRANGGFLSYSDDGDEDDYDYEGKLKLKSLGAMADIYPFGGSFRLSVGARSSRNRVTAVVTPTTNIDIGDETYTPAQAGILTGEVKFKKFAPTVMLGWGGKLKGGLHFGIEAGLVMQGSPQAEVRSQGSSLEGTPAFAQFQAELQQEVDEAEEDAKDFKFWPVLQFHLSWRF